MSELDDLARIARERRLRLPVSPNDIGRLAQHSALALFYEPLLALTMLLMVARRREVVSGELPVWTAATLAHYFFGWRSDKRLAFEWSSSFRERCAGAIAVLEGTGVVTLLHTAPRRATLTPQGVVVTRDLLGRDDEVGVLSRELRRSETAMERIGLTLL